MPGTPSRPPHGPLKSQRRNFLRGASAWSATALVLPISGCASLLEPTEPRASYKLDALIASPNQDSRVRTLVLHYTALPLGASIAILTDPKRAVSAHYLVPNVPRNDGEFGVFALVPESRLARHAGVSYWQGERMLTAHRSASRSSTGAFRRKTIAYRS
jgi:N-acetyl-anhydromuramyl-L-alanine amidase AmpD